MGESLDWASCRARAVWVKRRGYAAAAALWYPNPPSLLGRLAMRVDCSVTLVSTVDVRLAMNLAINRFVFVVTGLFHSVDRWLGHGWAWTMSAGSRCRMAGMKE